MWQWFFGSWRTVGYVATSTVLIYVSVVIGVRFGERRTLTEMTIYDFATAIALGAIIGRTATTESPSYVQGLAAVVTLLVVHQVFSWARIRWRWMRRLTERKPIVLLRDGKVLPTALRQAHMTENDLRTVLRERGVADPAEAAVVLLESRGAFSVLQGDVGSLDVEPANPEQGEGRASDY